jgi:predicted dehydrogenase
MKRNKTVRIGIVGLGNMGTGYVKRFEDGEINRAELVAICDLNPARLAAHDDKYRKFTDSRKLIRSGLVDAVMIVTPHYAHTTIGIDALENNLHVLVEKPISVHKADCERLIAAHKGKRRVFAAMFNKRTDPQYQRIRSLVQNGELGRLLRVNWIVTTWFRTESYYASGGWRATWAGEGGGVLLNQCPHQLDLLQWICGMPSRVAGFCKFGLRHDIEVEDEVTAYLEYPNGATGVFVTSTGEAPGSNRLEIAGEHGKLIHEGGKLQFVRNEISCIEFCKTTDKGFDKPPAWDAQVLISGRGGEHREIVQNFVDAILDKVPLVAPAREGIRSVELGNAMLLSSWLGKPVDLPLNSKVFEAQIRKRIRTSRYEGEDFETGSVEKDMGKSF